MSFAGKAAIVAGAGGGMGLNIANDLIAEGAHVALLDIKAKPADIRSGPGRSFYEQGDVTDDAHVKGAIAKAEKTFGRLDYLVNTTGVLWFDRDKSLVEMDMDVWDRVLAINLKSFALTARHAIPAMKRSGGGAMVHFSSVQALRGDTKAQDAYGASKGAVISLSKSIAIQFAADRIRSNAILPGATLSPMQARWEGKTALQAQISTYIPLSRIGTTQDQANAALFLLSEKASYITGTELIVDGGLTALPYGPDSIEPASEDSGDVSATEEVSAEFVAAGCDAAPVLDPAPHAFDPIASPIEAPIVGDRFGARCSSQHHQRRRACRAPGNWKCEEQRVQSRIVEAFAEKAAGPASLPALNRVPVATRDSPRGQAASVPAQQPGYFAVPPTMP